MPQLNARELTQGRDINRLDVARGAPVCDVGYDIVNNCCPASTPSARSFAWTRASAK